MVGGCLGQVPTDTHEHILVRGRGETWTWGGRRCAGESVNCYLISEIAHNPLHFSNNYLCFECKSDVFFWIHLDVF